MRLPFIEKTKCRQERGFYIPLLAVSFFAVLLVVGLLIDSADIFGYQRRAERAAQAAVRKGMTLIETRPNAFIVNEASRVVAKNLQQMKLPFAPEDIEVSLENRILTANVQVHVPLYLMRLIPGIPDTMPVRARARSGAPPVSVAVLFDTSQSMIQNPAACSPPITDIPNYVSDNCTPDGNNRCERACEAKKALKAFLRLLNPTSDKLAIFTFSNSSTQVFNNISGDDPVHPGPIDTAYLDWKIEHFSFTNSTCIACAMEQALSTIESSTASNYKTIIMFTDGRPTVPALNWNNDHVKCGYGGNFGHEGLNRAERERRNMVQVILQASRARFQGISVQTIGFGDSSVVCGTSDNPAGSPNSFTDGCPWVCKHQIDEDPPGLLDQSGPWSSLPWVSQVPNGDPWNPNDEVWRLCGADLGDAFLRTAGNTENSVLFPDRVTIPDDCEQQLKANPNLPEDHICHCKQFSGLEYPRGIYSEVNGINFAFPAFQLAFAEAKKPLLLDPEASY